MTKPQEISKKMRAVVLAAGLGKRMRSDTAKVMHPVLGMPMIWRILQTLNQLHQSLEEVYVILGHNAEQVEKSIERYRQVFKPRIAISTHIQEPQLGTGHALMALREVLSDFQVMWSYCRVIVRY